MLLAILDSGALQPRKRIDSGELPLFMSIILFDFTMKGITQ
jgi:hypothetical protein